MIYGQRQKTYIGGLKASLLFKIRKLLIFRMNTNQILKHAGFARGTEFLREFTEIPKKRDTRLGSKTGDLDVQLGARFHS